ncbi:MAG: ABC transporter permease [Clostridia bacterium]|nr:ABC transporter permease [Clostridia bacterium]
MNSYEKEEIAHLPEKYRPMGAWTYFGYSILFSLPVIGLIVLIVCAFSDSNINRRSFARSYFCVALLIVILIAILFAVGVGGAIVEIIKGNMAS